MDDKQIIEIWDLFKEYISEKSKEAAADQFIEFLLDNDIEISILEGLLGFDPHLDQAINLVLDEIRADEEPELDEDNWDSDFDKD